MTNTKQAGRFVPATQIRNSAALTGIIGDISALLHMENERDGLAAVQYCVSELIRNVLEHSGSPDGAFVCAHRFTAKPPRRVTIAVADCGSGVAEHLGRVHPEALQNDAAALKLAMTPGITGALSGMYGTPDNAGAGLFITRSIAKATGGYFLMYSGRAAYRLMRQPRTRPLQLNLYQDAYMEPRHNAWSFPDSPWDGTVVAVEIVTDNLSDFQGIFKWIRKQLPPRHGPARKLRFT